AARYREANAVGTAHLLAAATRAEVDRFVLISTRAIEPKGGAYSRSKMVAETLVRQSGVQNCIVRLPEVYGAGGTEGVDRIILSAQHGFPIPLVGGGHDRICPIYVDDAVAACWRGICQAAHPGRIFTLAGPCMTVREFAELCIDHFGSRSRIVRIPVIVVRML